MQQKDVAVLTQLARRKLLKARAALAGAAAAGPLLAQQPPAPATAARVKAIDPRRLPAAPPPANGRSSVNVGPRTHAWPKLQIT